MSFTNDLRIREQEVGCQLAGSWGSVIKYLSGAILAEAFSYGTEALADSAAQTLTLADGASDELRSLYLKLTGTLSQATTVTIAPNTISKCWIIENATTGGYDVTISQGSGANVTVGNGNVKMIATDGAGAGGVVYDLLTDLELAGKLLLGTPASRTMSGVTPNFFIEGTSYADSGLGAVINANGAIDCPVMLFGKSRGTSLGSNTIVQNGDRLFTMRFDGSDGTNLEQAAIIEAYVDAAPANNSVPGRLSFWTTNDGAQYATEKMRIDNAGAVGIKNTSPSDASWGSAGTNAELAIGNTSSGSNYGILHLLGHNTQATRYSIGAGDGTLYLAYDDVNGAHRINVQNSGITQFKTGDGQSGIAEFHTNASSGSASGYISIRPQGTPRGYIGSGSALLTGAGDDEFIIRSEAWLDFCTGGNNRRMSISTSGKILIGTTSGSYTHDLGMRIRTNEVGANVLDAALNLEGSGGDFYAQNWTGPSDVGFGLLAVFSGTTDYLTYRYMSGGTVSYDRFTINDTGDLSCAGTLTESTSDERLKSNITLISDPIEKIKSIRGVEFDWKETTPDSVGIAIPHAGKHEVGVIAQEVQKILPDAVSHAPFDNDKGESVTGENYLTVNYKKLIPILIEGIKEQQTQIESLQSEVAALKGA